LRWRRGPEPQGLNWTFGAADGIRTIRACSVPIESDGGSSSLFDAFSSREPVSTSLENALVLLEPALPMKLFFLKVFTWWNGQTFGTQLWTWRFGELVGEDEQGNRYFRTKGRKIDPSLGFERRWVVYNGYAEATKVPPSWHGWLHHTVDVAPTEETYKPHEWEKPHLPNMTGTPAAYRPPGSTLASGRRPKATGDYQPWTPGN
jgi:NADH:ubiquinone oxidoreductase subunit